MNNSGVQNIIGPLKLAKFNEKKEEIKDFEREQLSVKRFLLPTNLESTFPLVSIDGSYCILFSFLGMDTWVCLFRIGITKYKEYIINN
jgi:hypothetical protein